MKFLKALVLVIVVIIAVVVIYGATQPSQMEVKESIEINAPASLVFEEIEDFEAWDDWSAWSKMDPNMLQTYEGEIGTVGYKNSWVSKNQKVGTGSQEIIEIRDNEYMKTKMGFNDNAAENLASFTLTENDGKTTVVWDMIGAETPFYFRIINTIFKPMIAESYKSSLIDLKKIVESKTIVLPNPLGLKIVEVEGMSIISIKDSCAVGEVPTRMTEIYTELGIFMAINNIETAGNGLALYYAYSPEKVVFEPAFPIIQEVEGTDRVKVKEGPFGRAIKAIHVGDYEGLSEVRLGIKEYAKKINVELTNSYWEVYFNQSVEIEGAQSETHIYYSVK
jgi:effector-binding domain-containing protein/uncharacterized protein YndB with AHSA1/START domain